MTINPESIAADATAGPAASLQRAAPPADSGPSGSGPVGSRSAGPSRSAPWDVYSSTALRCGALLVAIIPLSALWTASRLEPSTSGIGTHQQLGLPPCSMRVMFSIRCPGCGMTTSWAHFTRGQWMESIQVNIGGFLLAWFSLLVALVALRTCWRGRLPSLRTQQVLTYASIAIAIVTLVNWAVRMTNVQ